MTVMSARVPSGQKDDAALGGSGSAIKTPAPPTGTASEAEEITQAGAEQVEGAVEGGERERQGGAEAKGWEGELQRAGVPVLKGAVAGALLFAAIPISFRVFVGPPRRRYPFDTLTWFKTLEAAYRMATGGAVVGGTITTAVLLLGTIKKDYPSKDAGRSKGACMR
ncbi:hypothetical protein KFL_000840145 [Klebsormidium nitens]|uniref:Uncharacterized protein n=1 Tax=Klebsormidium nitens TaxID=105231 RepID=A0A1Y1HUS1_KLENI|nr:hypothetical protein KFL_000840145 [Klebsormidium nitens]|eukprot:GAQ81572.1 hypothetical protein KFL_000840145 [Klebsormidium nitens]